LCTIGNTSASRRAPALDASSENEAAAVKSPLLTRLFAQASVKLVMVILE